MAHDLQQRNNALDLNPSTLNGVTADISSTVHGSDFYFAVCAIMGVMAIATLGLSTMKPRQDRIFFYITAALNATACIAYFSMGSNLGFAPIGVEFVRSDPKVAGLLRQVFYARYIDWVVTTPLLLMDLMLTAAFPWPTILWTIFLDEVMIVTGLIGALVQSRYKFGFFTIGCLAMFGVFYELVINGRPRARALGNDVYKAYMFCGLLTLVLWSLYPIAWGLSEGGNVISPDSEAVFYGILDLVAKPVFSMALIALHWNISPARMGLQIHDYAYDNNDQDRLNEKNNRNKTVQPNLNNNHNNDVVDSPPYAQSTSYTPNDTNDTNNYEMTGHSAHTQGYAPAHERTTVEGGQHLATAHHDGQRI